MFSERSFEVTDRDWQVIAEGGPIRFALVGVGMFTRDYVLPAVEQSDFCEATVLVSGSKEKATSVAAAHGVSHGITYEEFHNGDFASVYDAVYICTPNALHLPYVETATRLEKAILCEKPMEATVERAQRIVEITKEAGVSLMIAYRMHTEPAIRRARELIRKGIIGDPIQVHSAMTEHILEFIPDPDQWRLDPELSGGGAMMDIGIYPLNTSRFLLEDEVMAVSATTRSTHDAFSDVDEYVSFRLEFAEDTIASCLTNLNAYETSHIEVIGTEGRLRVEPAFAPHHDRELTVERNGTISHVSFEQANQITEEFDYFAHCLITGDPIYADGTHGLTDLEIIESVYDSADSKATVWM